MKRFVINTIFFALLLALIAGTIMGPRGFLHLLNLREEFGIIEARNEKLKQENEKLKAEIANLKNNLRYLEELSRNELGLAKKNELLYRTEKMK